MAEKDVVEKNLQSYNDIFADIVNVLMFDGEQVVKSDNLRDSLPRSLFRADDTSKIHEQERDVAKLWMEGNRCTKITLFGLENQSDVDADMPMRVLSYDGASYKTQLLNKGSNQRYPVVSIVLNFSMKKWNAPTSIYEMINWDIVPESLKPYINDYKIHVYDIAYLDNETVKKFQSDFRVVAEYFTQQRKGNQEYEPEKIIIKHVDAVLKFLSAVSTDKRFEFAYVSEESKEGGISMSSILDSVEKRGHIRIFINLLDTEMSKQEAQKVTELTDKDVESALRIKQAGEMLKKYPDETIDSISGVLKLSDEETFITKKIYCQEK